MAEMTISDELDILHDRLGAWLLAGDFSKVEGAMDTWDFSSDPDLALAFLSITLPFASALPGRPRFYERARKAARRAGRSVEALDGLSGRPEQSAVREAFVVERRAEDNRWFVDASHVGPPGTEASMRKAYARTLAAEARVVRYVPDEWVETRSSAPEEGAEVDFVTSDGLLLCGTWSGTSFYGCLPPRPGRETAMMTYGVSEVVFWRLRPQMAIVNDGRP